MKIFLNTESARCHALDAVRNAPYGCTVEVAEMGRSNEQNAKLHACLVDEVAA